MRTLERDLGVRLLHRTTRSLSPTEAGERLQSSLAPVLRSLDERCRRWMGFVSSRREHCG